MAMRKRMSWAKAGATLDEGFTAETRAKTVQQEREEVYAALQYAATFHCLVEEWKDCEELSREYAHQTVSPLLVRAVWKSPIPTV